MIDSIQQHTEKIDVWLEMEPAHSNVFRLNACPKCGQKVGDI